MKQLFKVERKNERWQEVARRAIAATKEAALSGLDFQVVIDEVKRTLDQNAAMWPALGDWAKQVPWQVNGEARHLAPEEWKDILTAAFEKEVRIAPGLHGGFVLLGVRTSKYGKRKMGDFLTFIRAEGNDRGVVWSEKARDTFDEFIPAQRRAA